MSERSSSPIFLPPYPKSGVALHVEQTVQGLADSGEGGAGILRDSDSRLTGYFAETVSGRYECEKRRQQIDLAVIGLEIWRCALPTLLDVQQEQGSFAARPEVADGFFEAQGIDIFKGHAPSSTYAAINRTSYWLLSNVSTSVAATQERSSPLYPVWRHFESATETYVDAHQAWLEGPGRNRWPQTTDPGIITDREGRIMRMLHTNTVGVALSLIAARAIHHMLHANKEAPSEQLAAVTAASLPQIATFASTDRHLAWHPNWRELIGRSDFGNYPTQGVLAILQCPVAKITQPNAYDAAVNGMAIMRDPAFFPSDVIRRGAVQNAASCAGNVHASYTNAPDIRNNRQFFHQMGLAAESGNRFSLVNAALAMGQNTFERLVLPAYETNRAASEREL